MNQSSALSLENGTYPFVVGAPSGYDATPASGQVKIAGANASVPIRFAVAPSGNSSGSNNSTSPPPPGPAPPTTTDLRFTETGLPFGARWWVSLNGNASLNVSTSGDAISFNLTNGTYRYALGTGAGYAPVVSGGVFELPGAPTTLAMSFRATSPGPGSPSASTVGSTPLPGPGLWLLAGLGLIGLVAVESVAVLRVLRRSRRDRSRVGRAPSRRRTSPRIRR